MIKVVDKVLNDTVFKILIVAITFLMQVHFIHIMYGGYVKYVLAFGILVCGWQLLNKILLGKLSDKVSILLIAFSVSYAITILLNRDNCFSQNVNQLVYMVVFFLLLFISGRGDTYDHIKREMQVLSWIMVGFSAVLALLTILLHVYNISEWYMISGSEEYFFIGNGWFDFWSFCNPNIGGTIAVVSILMSLFLMCVCVANKNMSVKNFGILVLSLNVVCEYVVVLLLDSRGAYYGLIISVTVCVFLIIHNGLESKKKMQRILVAGVLSVCLCGVMISVSSFVDERVDELVIVSDEDASDITKDTEFENVIEDILKDIVVAGTPHTGRIGFFNSIIMTINENDLSTTNDFTTGRIGIWRAGVESFKTAPIFGLTREGLVGIVQGQFDEGANTSAVVGGGLHNMYLTVLCASGVVGFVILAAAVCIVLYRFFKCLVKSPQIDMCMLFAFVICLFFFITELVENRILYQVNFFNVVFWIYFGYLNKLSLLKLEEISKNND